MLEIETAITLHHKALLSMATQQDLLADLDHIRQTMQRSDRMLTLDGRSGVICGLICLTGLIAGQITFVEPSLSLPAGPAWVQFLSILAHHWTTTLIAHLTFGACLAVSYWSAARQNTRTHGHQSVAWSRNRLKFVLSLGIPIVTGAVLCAILIVKEMSLVPGMAMVCYGLALHSGSQNAKTNITPLALVCICSGLVAFAMPHYNVLMLGMSFGLAHIAQGIWMMKTDKA